MQFRKACRNYDLRRHSFQPEATVLPFPGDRRGASGPEKASRIPRATTEASFRKMDTSTLPCRDLTISGGREASRPKLERNRGHPHAKVTCPLVHAPPGWIGVQQSKHVAGWRRKTLQRKASGRLVCAICTAST